jgi:hypothetical protein
MPQPGAASFLVHFRLSLKANDSEETPLSVSDTSAYSFRVAFAHEASTTSRWTSCVCLEIGIPYLCGT